MHLTLFQILALLREEPADASTVLEGLGRLLPDRDVPSLPAFYRHLRRAMESGWVEVEGTDPDDDGPGRPARVYRLTREGAEALRERARELEAFTSLALGGEGGGGGRER